MLNAIFVMLEYYWFTLIPFCCLLLLFLFYRLDNIFLFIAFCTPLSIELENLFGGMNLNIPTEPFLFLLMSVFLIKVFNEKSFDRKILNHPITIAILFNLIWILFTVLFSEMPLVSIKYFISRLWFVVCFYFLATMIFKNLNYIKVFIWLFIIPLALVVIYTLINHAQYMFTQETSTWVMQPFFRDHGVYAAVIALFIPILIVWLLNNETFKYGLLIKIMMGFLILIFIIGIIFSYTRATWISIGASLIMYLLLALKVRFRILSLTIISLIILGIVFYSDIDRLLSKNRVDSSSEYSEHLQSIYNVSTNASNLERINRWHSAFRMFLERPVFGFGPGTYMFQYAPFQHSNELTIISTNTGTLGNAHSEYLGSLAETGLPGSLSLIIIVVLVIRKGMKIYYSAKDKKIKYNTLGILLGLTTYFIHGLLNNYIDQDKAAIPFWSFIACITVLDLYGDHSKDVSN